MSDTITPDSTPGYRELRRSRSERMLAGVCGGLGQYFDITPAFFRVGFVVLALLGGSGILIYIAAALVIPDEGKRDSIAGEILREHRERPWALIGLALVAVAVIVLLSHATFWPRAGGIWVLVLIVGGAILWSQRRDRRAVVASPVEGGPPPPRAPKRFALGLPALGVLVVSGGLLGLLDASGVDVRWDLAVAVAAIAAGAAVVVGAILRLRVGGLAALAVVLGAVAICATAFDFRFEGPVGERTFHPASAAELRESYRLSIGELDLNLSDVSVTEPTRVDASIGFGALHVLVPADARVRVEPDVAIGDVTILGRKFDGPRVDKTVVDGADGPELVVHAEVGFGELLVERSVR